MEAEDINMDILSQITVEQLRSIGVSTFGHRFRITEGVHQWVNGQSGDVGVVEETVQEGREEIEREEEDRTDGGGDDEETG